MNKIRCKAKVLNFYRYSGDGLIRLIGGEYDGMILSIDACNVEGKKTWYSETACVYYDKDDIIDVEVKWDSYATFVIGLTPGKFDGDKWNKLDHDRLAFRCDEKGVPITGLFSTKKST